MTTDVIRVIAPISDATPFDATRAQSMLADATTQIERACIERGATLTSPIVHVGVVDPREHRMDPSIAATPGLAWHLYEATASIAAA